MKFFDLVNNVVQVDATLAPITAVFGHFGRRCRLPDDFRLPAIAPSAAGSLEIVVNVFADWRHRHVKQFGPGKFR